MDVTAVLWSLVVLIVVIFFAMIAMFLKGLIDRLITLIENVNDKLSSIEGELKPIMRDTKELLGNVEPLTKELGERGEDIGRLLTNVEKVTDDLQATTGAIRGGIVPIAHTLTGLFAGLMEGARALSESRRSEREDDYYQGDEQ